MHEVFLIHALSAVITKRLAWQLTFYNGLHANSKMGMMNMMWDYSPSLCGHKQFSGLGKIQFIFQISCLLHQSLVFSCIFAFVDAFLCVNACARVCSKMFVKSTSKKALIIFHLCCIYSTVAVQQLLQLYFFLLFLPFTRILYCV